MKIYVVIPAHNEEAFLRKTLDSLINQTLRPSRIVVVNDNSSDGTQEIINTYSARYSFIEGVTLVSSEAHAPGSKVINAFYKGYEKLDTDFDVICKFDADLIFPSNYLETIANVFKNSENVGLAGGFCYIEKNGTWELEDLTGKDHIRGALKSYRKECLRDIKGLRKAMGWDTIDELLAQYHGWELKTLQSLKVKHLKPTATAYAKRSGYMQGAAFKRMRYGFLLTLIAALKLAWKKKSLSYFLTCLKGFISEKNSYLVSSAEGKFIRKLRWRNIRRKLL
ncbi:MAG: glycosyltransferase family 2 protein [Flavobacterium sp.]|nr:MAG: glycosyltransferase family 2 protein [Flavobacterium sp.]